MNNAFEILGLEARLIVSAEELKDAFREAGKRSHPDGGGGETEFARLQGAFELLSSPSRRLKHWMEVKGTPIQARGTIDPAMMDLFAETGMVTQQAEAMIRKREETKSALAKAMLEEETQLRRESVEKMISRLETLISEQCGVFAELETTADLEIAAERARNLTFLEKWRAGLRSCFARLV